MSRTLSETEVIPFVPLETLSQLTSDQIKTDEIWKAACLRAKTSHVSPKLLGAIALARNLSTRTNPRQNH